jgi:hypothetical protein
MQIQSGSRVELQNGQRGTVREKRIIDETLTLTVQIDEFPERDQWIQIPAELVNVIGAGAAERSREVGG